MLDCLSGRDPTPSMPPTGISGTAHRYGDASTERCDAGVPDPAPAQLGESSGSCPELSIIICTHNRPDELEDLLTLLIAQGANQPVELIVVDSASAPEAASRIAASIKIGDVAKLVRLDNPGVSLARNAGALAARGRWLAFVDDDEIPMEGWVGEAIALSRRLPESCAACGGNVLPLYPDNMKARPNDRWLRYLSMSARSGEFDQSQAPFFLIGHSLIRASVMQEVGGFDLRLGRVGSLLLSGEEVLFIRKLMKRGWTIWHSGLIEVGHRIPPERLTRAWVKERAYWEGITTVRVYMLDEPSRLSQMAIASAFKEPLLRMAALLLRERGEADLRWAFVRGVRTALSQRRRSQDVSMIHQP